MNRFLSLVAAVVTTAVLSGCWAIPLAYMNMEKKQQCNNIYADKSLSGRSLDAALYKAGCNAK